MAAIQSKEKILNDEIVKFRALQKGTVSEYVCTANIKHCTACLCGALQLETLTCLHVDAQKCVASKGQLEAQLLENQNVKDVGCHVCAL